MTYTKRGERDAASDERVKPIELQRNYTNIWQKYPQYDETNTLMISNFYNLEEEFRRNDLVLPQYHPKLGQTDFLDDKHLAWTAGYIAYLACIHAATLQNFVNSRVGRWYILTIFSFKEILTFSLP